MSLASDIIQKVSNVGTKFLQSVDQGVGEAAEFVRKNPVTSAAAVSGGILAGGAVVQIVKSRAKKRATSKTKTKKKTKTSKSKKRKRTTAHTKRGWKLDRAKRSKEPHELAYQRRKKKSAKKGSKKRPGKIYYTRKGQPYKILASGKARFIKKIKRSKK